MGGTTQTESLKGNGRNGRLSWGGPAILGSVGNVKRILYIKDLVTYEAQTPAELRTSFEAAVDDYFDTCEQIGKQPEKSFKGTFNVRMTPELHKAAAVAAALQETTLNDFVAQAVADKLAMQKKKRWSREPHLAVAEENEPYRTNSSM